MKREFLDDRSAATAVEFALVGPLFLLTAFAALETCIAIWNWNNLQSAARLAARCLAIASPLCGTPGPSCSSQDAAVCYALKSVRDTGAGDATRLEISIDRADMIDGIAFTTVRYALPAHIVGIDVTLRASASFPNN